MLIDVTSHLPSRGEAERLATGAAFASPDHSLRSSPAGRANEVDEHAVRFAQWLTRCQARLRPNFVDRGPGLRARRAIDDLPGGVVDPEHRSIDFTAADRQKVHWFVCHRLHV